MKPEGLPERVGDTLLEWRSAAFCLGLWAGLGIVFWKQPWPPGLELWLILGWFGHGWAAGRAGVMCWAAFWLVLWAALKVALPLAARVLGTPIG